MEIFEGNDEEIELSLGLSIGGGRSFKKFQKSNQSLTFEMKFLDQNDNNNNGLDLENRKMEIHKEPTKKIDIKKNGRKLPEFEQEEDKQSRSFKKLKPGNEEMGKEKGDIGAYPSMKYGYHHQSMQCVNPFSNGFGFPAAYEKMPFLVPPPTSSSSSPETAVVNDKNVVQPIVCKHFIRPLQFLDSPPKAKIPNDGAVIKDSAVVEDHHFDNETSSSTQSAQSPPLNQPHHLHKSNNVPSFNTITATQSNLSNKSVEEPIYIPHSVPMIIINTSKTQLLPPLQQSRCANNKPPLPLSPNKVNDVETNQLNKQETNKSEIPQIKSLPKMPCVSTVGDGPDGKTITGFLYRYTNAQVSIVCVCHGSSFSPAEFVKHAGRTDVSQPLKHIVVLPTPFS